MSKAFTRESDDLPDRPAVARPASALPPGAKNYMTADGARRLQDELERLLQVERPQLAASSNPQDAREKLQALDQRILQLQESVQSAVVVPPPAVQEDRVKFGALVTVRDRQGEESRYRIVGTDEIDLDRGWVSWLSPIARALLNQRVGERIRLRLPAGEEELEVLKVEWTVPDREFGHRDQRGAP